MNYDMFSGNQFDNEDSNYIYPRPYIDPTVYVNPYYINGMPFQGQQLDPNINGNINGYMTYMNPYMSNPVQGTGQVQNNDSYVEYPELDDQTNSQNTNENTNENQPNNQTPNGTMPNGMPYGMPYMPNGYIPQPPNGNNSGAVQAMNMNPYMAMMFPQMMFPPMMQNMYMVPGMPPISMEEFDEEEM